MDKNKQHNKRFYERKNNRFMDLRYSSKTDEHPKYTIGQLAEIFDCSKGTISQLEAEDISEEKTLSKSARLFKAYHDFFGCSYEYLFGETTQSDPQYLCIDSNSPLCNLDSNTLNNLEQLLTDDEFANFNRYMFAAIISDPIALQNVMAAVFKELYIIDLIYKNTELHKAEKEINSSKYWAKINDNIETYLTKHLIPCLQIAFKKYEEKETERGEALVRQADELFSKPKAPIVATIVNN